MNEEEKPPINLPYIRKVLEHIEGNLDRLYMNAWYSSKDLAGEDATDSYYDYEAGTHGRIPVKWPECNTRACFAGWGYLLNLNLPVEELETMRPAEHEVTETAQRLYGFTEKEAKHVFMSPAISIRPDNKEEQLAVLKSTINNVLAARGLDDRV